MTFGREIDSDAVRFKCSIGRLFTASICWTPRLCTATELRDHPRQVVAGPPHTRVHDRGDQGERPPDAQHILQSVEGSLTRLGVEPLDLLQAHAWDDQTPLEETLDTFDSLVRQGKIRHYGCSNWDPDHVLQALSLSEKLGLRRLESVHVHCNLVDPTIDCG